MARLMMALIGLTAAPALAAAPAQAQHRGQGGVHIEGAGQERSVYDCAGGPASIEGAGNEVTITGACSALTITGASNIVRIDLAPGATIRIEGAGNQVRWTMPGNARPRQSVQGASNSVSRGS